MICTAILTHQKLSSKLSCRELTNVRLRTFAISKILSDLTKRYQLDKKLQDMEIKNEKLLKEEEERRKILKLFFGSQNGSSSFFNDFQPNRFF